MKGNPRSRIDLGRPPHETSGQLPRSRLPGGKCCKRSTGTWTTCKGTGKFKYLKGQGTSPVKPGEQKDEFILEIEGEYDL